jgi:hypothetical protein
MNMSHGIIILIFLIFGAVFANMHMSVLKQNENLISKNTHLNVGVDEHGPMDLLHIDGDHSMKVSVRRTACHARTLSRGCFQFWLGSTASGCSVIHWSGSRASS